MSRVLITGALGQIGRDLTVRLRARYGADAVLATDVRHPNGTAAGGPTALLDATDEAALGRLVNEHGATEIVHLASLLSATSEQRPDLAWNVNLGGLRAVLKVAQARGLQVFWPSSIAVFGPGLPKEQVPQQAPLVPSTMYGVTKVAGELLCHYQAAQGLDVRSLRFPGLISHSAPAGGGTTDYAVDIFHAAVKGERFTCFLRPETRLPMMYMPDAVGAVEQLMLAPADRLTVRTSYNLGALSFSCEELADAIRRRIPGFEIDYAPDFRQAIADSWPASIDDSAARADWDWQPAYDLDQMVDDMLLHLRERYATPAPTSPLP